jgi:UDP-glucose 4-epimerase
MVTEMHGQRVLVSGMGGELGSLVASLLEKEPSVGSLLGVDVDPPRRRLRRAAFHLVSFDDRSRVVETITAFNPHVVVHLAVWEPDARAGTAHAQRLTHDAAHAVLGAAAECRALEAIVVRSGIEVYGRARRSATRPNEDAPVHPTSQYGRMLADIERRAADAGRHAGVPVTALRLAPVIGAHVPSPLGRLLRQPAVPFSALADSPFTVVEVHDAARAVVAAVLSRIAAPINVAADGAVTTLQAIRRGRKVPLPMLGPEWAIARRISHLIGAPIPDHVVELMHRGRLADNSRCLPLLGVGPTTPTTSLIDQLFAWESVIRVPSQRKAA